MAENTDLEWGGLHMNPSVGTHRPPMPRRRDRAGTPQTTRCSFLFLPSLCLSFPFDSSAPRSQLRDFCLPYICLHSPAFLRFKNPSHCSDNLGKFLLESYEKNITHTPSPPSGAPPS